MGTPWAAGGQTQGGRPGSISTCISFLCWVTTGRTCSSFKQLAVMILQFLYVENCTQGLTRLQAGGLRAEVSLELSVHFRVRSDCRQNSVPRAIRLSPSAAGPPPPQAVHSMAVCSSRPAGRHRSALNLSFQGKHGPSFRGLTCLGQAHPR